MHDPAAECQPPAFQPHFTAPRPYRDPWIAALERQERRRRPPRRPTTLHVHQRFLEDEMLPLIRLSGAWLDELGFSRHAVLTVTARRGRIVLRLAAASVHEVP